MWVLVEDGDKAIMDCANSGVLASGTSFLQLAYERAHLENAAISLVINYCVASDLKLTF